MAGDFTKRIGSTSFVRHAVAYLNDVTAADPSVAAKMVPHDDDDDPGSAVTVVGVINTILQRAASSEYLGHGEDENGRIHFHVVPADEVERAARRTPS